MAERTSGQWSRCHTVYMQKFFNSTNKAFVNDYVRLWCQLRETFYNEMVNTFVMFSNSAVGAALQSSYRLDNLAWDRNLYFQNNLTYRRQWLQRRFTWLDENILPMRISHDVNVDGVVNIADVTSLINMLLGGYPRMITGDIDEDSNINIADITALVNLLLTGNS